jgi:hypothetical protein
MACGGRKWTLHRYLFTATAGSYSLSKLYGATEASGPTPLSKLFWGPSLRARPHFPVFSGGPHWHRARVPFHEDIHNDGVYVCSLHQKVILEGFLAFLQATFFENLKHTEKTTTNTCHFVNTLSTYFLLAKICWQL